MKKLFLLLGIVALSVACVDKDDTTTSSLKDSQKVNLNNVITTQEYSIPAPQSGYYTVVYANGEVISKSIIARKILVPKGANITTQQVPLKKDNNEIFPNEYFIRNCVAYDVLHQTVLFEDQKIGDYDYNDLVIHCTYNAVIDYSRCYIRVGIQPIALGGITHMALCCDIYEGSYKLNRNEIVVASNVRNDLFNGQGGYLNTQKLNFENLKTMHDFKKITALNISYSKYIAYDAGAISVNWYIKVYDKNDNFMYRLNAVSSNYIDNNMINEENRPYGLVITATGKYATNYNINNYTYGNGLCWFNYPKEFTRIETAYPSFLNWLQGAGTTTLSSFYGDYYTTDNVIQAGQANLFFIDNSEETINVPFLKSAQTSHRNNLFYPETWASDCTEIVAESVDD